MFTADPLELAEADQPTVTPPAVGGEFPRRGIASGSPVRLFWIDGARHVDLYDKGEYVPTVVAELADFFGAQLGGSKLGDRYQDSTYQTVA